MHPIFKTILLIGIIAVSSGCSFNHHVAQGYDGYLHVNKSETPIPKAKILAKYNYSESTKNHHYQFRSFVVGHANRWIIEFAQILDSTMSSEEMKASFPQMSKSNEASSHGNVIEFNLLSYYFSNYGSHVRLNIEVKNDGVAIFSKDYAASGEGQAVQMWLGGVFGMMDAVRDSTKSSMDQILVQFINDINSLDEPVASMLTNQSNF